LHKYLFVSRKGAKAQRRTRKLGLLQEVYCYDQLIKFLSKRSKQMVTLETERLLLRMFREQDFDEYALIFSNPEVTRYLGDGEPLSLVSGQW
jgi:RimJ/RimL family protein N-acetyltransferase